MTDTLIVRAPDGCSQRAMRRLAWEPREIERAKCLILRLALGGDQSTSPLSSRRAGL